MDDAGHIGLRELDAPDHFTFVSHEETLKSSHPPRQISFRAGARTTGLHKARRRGRGADWQSAVSPIGNRQGVRLFAAFYCRRVSAECHSAIQPIANRRYKA